MHRLFIVLTMFGLLLLIAFTPAATLPSANAKQSGGILMDPLWTTGILTDDVGSAGLIVTDLSGDGIADILSCSLGAFYVLNATPDGTDYVIRHYSQRVSCQRIAVGDRNQDGIEEIYVAGVENNFGILNTTMYVYNGATFALENAFPLPQSYWAISGLVVADVDGDQQVEFVVVRENETITYNANFGISEWTAENWGGRSIAVGNVDGDSDIEMVINGNPARVLNAATESQEFAYSGGFGQTMDVGDVDGDGIDEIVFGLSGDLNVFAADSQTIQYTLEGKRYLDKVAVADIQGDSRAEIAVGYDQWGSVVGLNGADGALLWEIENPEHGISAIALGDTDQDGAANIVWGAGLSSTGRDILAVGDPATESITWIADDLDPWLTAGGGDVDADGQPELVVLNGRSNAGYDGAVLSLYDAATKALEWRGQVNEEAFFYNIFYAEVTQLDEDPALEIVMGVNDSYNMRIGSFDGATRTLEWESVALGRDGPSAFAVGNADEDPASEVVIANGDDRKVKVIDPATNTILWGSLSYDYPVQDVALGDLDGNGVPELVVLTERQLFVYDTPDYIPRDTFLLEPTQRGRKVLIANRDGVGAGELLVTTATDATFDTTLYAYAGDDFDPLWNTPLEDSIIYTMREQDVDYDGTPEILIAGSLAATSEGDEPPSYFLIAEQTATGVVEEYSNEGYWGWIHSLAFVDVDTDGTNELFFGSQSLAHLAQVMAPGTGPTPTPTNTPTATNTPTPTNTPTATNTPTPTATPTSTPTATATPTATSTPVPDGRMLYLPLITLQNRD